MRHLSHPLTMAALLAGLPVMAQTTTSPSERREAEQRKATESKERTEKQAAGKPKPLDAGVALSPMDQGQNEADLKLTQTIRKAVQDDKRLSFDAKNVKIITLSGLVTLRGQVASEQERLIIREHATAAAGEKNVVDELEVKGAVAPPTM